MAALQLAATPAQPPHGPTIPTSLAAPLAHNGLRLTRRAAQAKPPSLNDPLAGQTNPANRRDSAVG